MALNILVITKLMRAKPQKATPRVRQWVTENLPLIVLQQNLEVRTEFNAVGTRGSRDIEAVGCASLSGGILHRNTPAVIHQR